MQDIPKRVCSIFKDARRALGLKQKALAAEIGCQQPALSMFEGGNPTKLSEELVNKLAREILEGKVHKDSAIEVDCVDGQTVLRNK